MCIRDRSLLALSGIVGGIAYMANQTRVTAKNSGSTATDNSDDKELPDEETSDDPDPATPSNDDSTTAATVDPNPIAAKPQPVLSQSLIEDDRQTLWETPTSGPKVDFSFLPTSPKMLLSVRPSELFLEPEGERILQSLGPNFASRLEQLKSQSGLDLSLIHI